MDKKRTTPKPGGVSRRDFMKGIGSGALGTAVLAPLRGQTIATKKGRVPVYDRKTISLAVNGRKLDLAVEANETLLDALRDRLDLTGAKRVCDRGECGGCTVLLDGVPVYACMTLAVRADGKTVKTVEGLAEGDKLSPVQ
ncbi:MAG TPA: 2Fe-2S iron-sulfur cluster-binding protein, partial [Acidobacteriota bacterium]|nr:2Fe-2S iron-sulfur cluster-binding protein [Acidobacteriota bacterium]